MMGIKDLIKERKFRFAAELIDCLHKLAMPGQPCVFRGQAQADWPLQPSIERAGWDAATWPGKEDYVRSEFKRRAHHYLLDLPDKDDELGWLALMRHHGAPSRLLDWTKSPYVAAFFAALDARPDKPFAIWALNGDKLKQSALGQLKGAQKILGKRNAEFKTEDLESWERFVGSPKNFEAAFLTDRGSLNERKDWPHFVVPLEPYRRNERLTIQQGVFMCANSLKSPFERILRDTLECLSEPLHKLVIDYDARFEVLAPAR